MSRRTETTTPARHVDKFPTECMQCQLKITHTHTRAFSIPSVRPYDTVESLRGAVPHRADCHFLCWIAKRYWLSQFNFAQFHSLYSKYQIFQWSEHIWSAFHGMCSKTNVQSQQWCCAMHSTVCFYWIPLINDTIRCSLFTVRNAQCTYTRFSTVSNIHLSHFIRNSAALAGAETTTNKLGMMTCAKQATP